MIELVIQFSLEIHHIEKTLKDLTNVNKTHTQKAS